MGKIVEGSLFHKYVLELSKAVLDADLGIAEGDPEESSVPHWKKVADRMRQWYVRLGEMKQGSARV